MRSSEAGRRRSVYRDNSQRVSSFGAFFIGGQVVSIQRVTLERHYLWIIFVESAALMNEFTLQRTKKHQCFYETHVLRYKPILSFGYGLRSS